VEPEFDQSRAKVLARSIGAKVVTIDPLAEDYAANLIAVAENIKRALK
jgi:zinc transport system substrate-binding protein